MLSKKKDKIINDPIYGFVTLENGIITDLIDHPFFQRLRKISQLGLSYLVYPGAHHTRFHHAIGCLHLMSKAIIQIKQKGHVITNEESEALKIAILCMISVTDHSLMRLKIQLSLMSHTSTFLLFSCTS